LLGDSYSGLGYSFREASRRLPAACRYSSMPLERILVNLRIEFVWRFADSMSNVG
jgi:hypothetical protein